MVKEWGEKKDSLGEMGERLPTGGEGGGGVLILEFL